MGLLLDKEKNIFPVVIIIEEVGVYSEVVRIKNLGVIVELLDDESIYNKVSNNVSMIKGLYQYVHFDLIQSYVTRIIHTFRN